MLILLTINLVQIMSLHHWELLPHPLHFKLQYLTVPQMHNFSPPHLIAPEEILATTFRNVKHAANNNSPFLKHVKFILQLTNKKDKSLVVSFTWVHPIYLHSLQSKELENRKIQLLSSTYTKKIEKG